VGESIFQKVVEAVLYKKALNISLCLVGAAFSREKEKQGRP
jgi:hypothetical protein